VDRGLRYILACVGAMLAALVVLAVMALGLIGLFTVLAGT
jgi:hypothetical protein